jgi:tetratricopeptide (TPR) repeat protein
MLNLQVLPRPFLRRIATAIGFAVITTSYSCSSPQQKYDRFLTTGKKHIVAREYARAILDFKNAVRIMPKKADPYYELGLAYLALKPWSLDAVAAFRKATELDPNHAGAQIKLAEMFVRSRDERLAEDAESRVQKVLAASPNDIDALFTLAATQVQLDRPDEAERYLKEILAKSPVDLKSSVGLAELKFSQKDIKGAEAALEDAVRKAPESPEAAVALGTLYASTGKLTTAKHLFEKAIQLDPKNPAALVRLGALQLKTGKNEEAEQTYRRLAALAQTEFKPAYGIFLMQQGRYGAAVAEFERLAKTNPADRVARTRLVAAYRKASCGQDAEAILTEALTKNPKDQDALLQRAELYGQSGKVRQAQSDLEALIRIDASLAQPHYLLAMIYKSQGSLLKEKQELGQALRLDPGSLPARIEFANLLIGSNATKAALEVLNDAPRTQKGARAWTITHNWALISDGDLAVARREVNNGLALSRTPDLVTQNGVLKLAAKDYAGARASFEEVLEANSGDVRVLSLLAQSYTIQKQQAVGVEKMRRYIERQSKSPGVQMFWANWLLENGNAGEARQALAVAQAADPRNVASELLLARVDLKERKVDDARRRLVVVLAREPSNAPAHMLLGALDNSENNHTGAIEHFRKAVESDGSNVAAMNNLASMLSRDSKHLDEALKYAQWAKELAADDSHVQDTLGWIYYGKGWYAMAEKELEGALAKEPRASIEFHLGMTYLKLGNSAKGQQLVSTALQTDPKLEQTEILR